MSHGQIELAVLQERAYINDIYTRVSQVDEGRGEQSVVAKRHFFPFTSHASMAHTWYKL